MTVCTFATNNLVRDHDIYEDFMHKRAEALTKDLRIDTPVLFYRKGLFNLSSSNKSTLYRAINRWHCIKIAVVTWNMFVGSKVKYEAGCKKIIHASREDIIGFKKRYEEAVELAKIHKYDHELNCCRYIAMYWTYLDIINDIKTDRFYPDMDTIEIAAEVFGYPDGDNPFVMNGKYYNKNSNTEETPVEEKTEVNDDILTTPIRDLNLTIRTFNCLWRAGIKTLGDICMKSQRQLLKVRNLGRNSLNEIKDKLAEYDYYYMDLDSNAQKAHPEEESVVDIVEQAPSEVLSGMKPIVSVDEYDELYKKYQELTKAHQALVEFANDLNAKYHAASETIKEFSTKINLDDIDMIDLVKLIVAKMDKDKMDWLFLTINGMTVDIHKKAEIENGRMSYTIRTREE